MALYQRRKYKSNTVLLFDPVGVVIIFILHPLKNKGSSIVQFKEPLFSSASLSCLYMVLFEIKNFDQIIQMIISGSKWNLYF